MKLVVTVYEATCEAAIAAIRAISLAHDGVEVRAEKFPSIDLNAIRASTTKPVILTYRGSRVPDVDEALEAGIDLVDVEWHPGVRVLRPERTVISHHDYEGMRDVEAIWGEMCALECAHTKLAATPRNFAENERLLALLPDSRPPRVKQASGLPPGRRPEGPRHTGSHATIIGMGERGLYSRILAPFLGSELVFVAGTNVAAPGQLTLERASQIYWPVRAERVFAVVGNPAGHSLSPVIHNGLFRQKGVSAAYTIASIESFDEITAAFLRGEPCGLSVTAPFKEDAFRFAKTHAPNAARARAVNTLVNVGGEILADNTDVDGFAALIEGTKAAVIGAGATARAALVALEEKGIPATVYNRTASKGDAALEELRHFRGDLVINTLPAGVDVDIPPCRVYVEAAYAGPERRVDCERRVTGLDLLHAQARRQHQLFMRVFE
jgi:shikimate 5-dehydrogenase/3-dehydroquinate dehydratase